MISSGILDVAIGLAFIYLLYSLLATTIQETLAVIWNLRAAKLQLGIKQMLTNTEYENLGEVLTAYMRKFFNGLIRLRNMTMRQFFNWITSPFAWAITRVKELLGHLFYGTVLEKNTEVKRSPELWQRFYNHPIIKNYGEGRLSKYPSYLPDGNFSTILLDVLKEDLNYTYMAAAKEELKAIRVKKNEETVPGGLPIETVQAKDLVPDAKVAKLDDSIKDDDPELIELIKKKCSETTLVEQLITLFDNSKKEGAPICKETAHILCLMLNTAGKDAKQTLTDTYAAQQAQASQKAVEVTETQTVYKTIELFKAALDKWFTDSMGRVTGWYKRQTQTMLIFIGIAISAAFNVDTVQIANKLSVDKDARKQITEMATAYMSSHKDTYVPGSAPAQDNRAVAQTQPVAATPDNTQKKYDSLVEYTQNLLKDNINNANNYLAIGYDGLGQDDPDFTNSYIQNHWIYSFLLNKYQEEAHVALISERDSIETQITCNDDIERFLKRATHDTTLLGYHDTLVVRQRAISQSIISTTKTLSELPLLTEPEQVSFDSIVAIMDKSQIKNDWILTRRHEALAEDTIKMMAVAYQYKDTAVLRLKSQLRYLQKRKSETTLPIKTINRFDLLKPGISKDEALTKLQTETDSLHSRSESLVQHSEQITMKKAVERLYTTAYLYILAPQYVWYETWNKNKWTGFLITALAISLGSPFWFDLLNKFMQLRGSVKNDSKQAS